MPPLRLVQQIRADTAIDLLRGSPPLALMHVARRVGLADAASLHRLFVRLTGRSPGTFRASKNNYLAKHP
jgi:AraC-like DNA-binding protein